MSNRSRAWRSLDGAPLTAATSAPFPPPLLLDPLLRKKRTKQGGNSGKNFTEGWMEFEDKAKAKEVRRSSSVLSTTQLGLCRCCCQRSRPPTAHMHAACSGENDGKAAALLGHAGVRLAMHARGARSTRTACPAGLPRQVP